MQEKFFDHVREGTLNVEEEDGGRFLVAPSLFDMVDQEVYGVGCGAAWTTTKLVAREELVFIAEVGEVFGDEGREEFANGVEQADGAICFGNVVSGFVWFPQHNHRRLEPSRKICVVFEDPFEGEIEIVDKEVGAFDEDDVGDVWRLSIRQGCRR